MLAGVCGGVRLFHIADGRRSPIIATVGCIQRHLAKDFVRMWDTEIGRWGGRPPAEFRAEIDDRLTAMQCTRSQQQYKSLIQLSELHILLSEV